MVSPELSESGIRQMYQTKGFTREPFKQKGAKMGIFDRLFGKQTKISGEILEKKISKIYDKTLYK